MKKVYSQPQSQVATLESGEILVIDKGTSLVSGVEVGEPGGNMPAHPAAPHRVARPN